MTPDDTAAIDLFVEGEVGNGVGFATLARAFDVCVSDLHALERMGYVFRTLPSEYRLPSAEQRCAMHPANGASLVVLLALMGASATAVAYLQAVLVRRALEQP